VDWFTQEIKSRLLRSESYLRSCRQFSNVDIVNVFHCYNRNSIFGLHSLPHEIRTVIVETSFFDLQHQQERDMIRIHFLRQYHELHKVYYSVEKLRHFRENTTGQRLRFIPVFSLSVQFGNVLDELIRALYDEPLNFLGKFSPAKILPAPEGFLQPRKGRKSVKHYNVKGPVKIHVDGFHNRESDEWIHDCWNCGSTEADGTVIVCGHYLCSKCLHFCCMCQESTCLLCWRTQCMYDTDDCRRCDECKEPICGECIMG
jgi:hypothetical protein